MIQILSSIRSSLKLKMIAFTIILFLLSMLSGSAIVSYMLREDMKVQLGHQQVATVTQVAREIDANLELRFKALELIALGIDSSMMSRPAILQRYLDQRPLLTVLFNSGVFVVNSNGDGVADSPVIGRIGTNYLDRDHIATALTEGKASIGKAVIGKRVVAPSFAMTVPIKDDQGRVIGAMAGATDLSKPNFLTAFHESTYGTTGGFLIVDPRNSQFVTTSMGGIYERLIMKPLPTREVNPLLYKRIEEGFSGTAVNSNSLGVEVLTSSATLPLANWIVISALPTGEAFAPIARMQLHILIATLVVTVIASGLLWIFLAGLLKRQFRPILLASEKLSQFADVRCEVQLLPVDRRDEVGLLFESVNRFLSAVSGREKRVHMLFDEAVDGIHIQDMQGNLIQFSASFAAMLGYTPAELQGRNVRDWDVGLSRGEIDEVFAKLNAKDNIFETKHRRKDGSILDVQIHAKRVDIDGNDCLYASARDITEFNQRARWERKVSHMAYYDVLTELPNRRLLQDRLGQALASARRSGRYGALMFIDLDNFKPLNDLHGHEAGDLLLIEVGKRIKGCVRDMDTVARIGGDEFVALIGEMDGDEATCIAEARIIAEKIRLSLAEPYQIAASDSDRAQLHIEHHCTASIGVVVFSGKAKDHEVLLSMADIAMYEAKEAGRNQVKLNTVVI